MDCDQAMIVSSLERYFWTFLYLNRLKYYYFQRM
jgi:hypothetical protein